MENIRNSMKIELVSDKKRFLKLVNKPNFKSTTIYKENLCAIHFNVDMIMFNKPIYVGFSILDISKTLMYKFHYNVMRQYYNNSIQLSYTFFTLIIF